MSTRKCTTECCEKGVGPKVSCVVNEPRIKNPLIKAIRELLEHRATWLYLLCDEGRKRGLDPRILAVPRCAAAG